MKLGDLGGQIAINCLIFNGSGGPLPSFPTTPINIRYRLQSCA